MFRKPILILFCLFLLAPCAVLADDLTRIIQQDLATLGYDTGGVDGKMGTKTIIAISKFQAEHDLEVTGEPTPQLAGVIKAAMRQGGTPQQASTATRAAPVEKAPDPQAEQAALRAAQQKCLEEKVAAAEEANKKKRGFGKLVRAVSRTASTFGGSELSRQLSRTSYEIYSASATAEDLAGAAEDLGLTEGEVEACRNPRN